MKIGYIYKKDDMPIIMDPVKAVFVEIIRSTCPLYLFDSRTSNLPRPHGCCVLLQHNGRYFALSNAHVLADDSFGKPQFLVRDRQSSTIGGLFLTSRLPPSQRREDDLLDIAVVQLNTFTTDLLKAAGYTFLTMGGVATGYTQMTDDAILIAGYPGSRTKHVIQDGKVEVQSLPFYFKSRARGTRTGERYSSGQHVFAHYPRTKLSLTNRSGWVTGPLPPGLSGSGMWLLQPDAGGLLRPALVAIFMEYGRNRSLLVGTKIDFLIDIIRQRIDASIPNYGATVRLATD